MLRYNLDYVFNLKGITNRADFLIKNGFSQNQRRKLKTNSYREISFELLEKLCLVFNCTPNDLIEFIPSEGVDYKEKVIVNLKKEKKLNLNEVLLRKPLDEVIKINEKINKIIEGEE